MLKRLPGNSNHVSYLLDNTGMVRPQVPQSHFRIHTSFIRVISQVKFTILVNLGGRLSFKAETIARDTIKISPEQTTGSQQVVNHAQIWLHLPWASSCGLGAGIRMHGVVSAGSHALTWLPGAIIPLRNHAATNLCLSETEQDCACELNKLLRTEVHSAPAFLIAQHAPALRCVQLPHI